MIRGNWPLSAIVMTVTTVVGSVSGTPLARLLRGRQPQATEVGKPASQPTAGARGWPGRGASRALRRRFVPGRAVRVLGLAAVTAVLIAAGSPVAAVAGNTQPQLSQATWQHAIKQVKAQGKGCFTASYPVVQWRKTQCTTTPAHPFGPAHPAAPTQPAAPHPQYVGGDFDFAAKVTGNPMSTATGSFDYISPDSSESGQQFGSGPQLPNTYSLQLNTNTFATSDCSVSPPGSGCQGWEQFIYSTADDSIFVEWWLQNYDKTCPAGWATWGTSCFLDSDHTRLPFSTPSVPDLSTVSMTGTASASNGDSVTLTDGNRAATSVGVDALHLAPAWTTVEWAIVGDGSSNGGGTSEANFTSGSNLILKTTVNNGTANMTPTCVATSYTAETNNLHLAPGPGLGVNALQASEKYDPPTVGQTCADAYPIQTPAYDMYHAALSANGTLNGPNPMGGNGGASTFIANGDDIAGMPDGSSQVVAIGDDGTLFDGNVYTNTRYANGSWSGWAPIPGINGAPTFAASSVAITAMPDGSSKVLAVDPSGDVVLNTRPPGGGWSGWSTEATNFADTYEAQGMVAIAGLPDGDTQIAVIKSNGGMSADGAVYSELLHVGGGHNALLPMAGYGGASTFVASGVAAVSLPDGNSELAAIGDDFNAYDVKGYSGNWSGWQPVPSFQGENVDTVGIGASASGNVQIIIDTYDNAMSIDTQDPEGDWSGWNQLQVNPCAFIRDATITGMPDGSSQILSDFGNQCDD